jgi:predicted dehydrogenase
VFCEKPLSSEPDEVVKLFNFANENGLSLYVNYIYTHSPSIKFIKNNLSRIGEIQHLEFSIKQFGKFYKNQNVFEVLGCHLLSVYFYLFEKFEPECMEVIVQTDYKKETALVQKLTIKNNEHSAIFNASLLNTSKERKIQIIGEKGIIVFNPLITNSVIIYKHNFEEVEEIEIKSFDEANNISSAIYHFNQMIDNKSENNEKLVINISKVLKKTKNGKG